MCTRYVKHFGLVPDVLLFSKKNLYQQFFVKNNLKKIVFFNFYATAKKKKIQETKNVRDE